MAGLEGSCIHYWCRPWQRLPAHAVRRARDILSVDICEDIESMEYQNASKAEAQQPTRKRYTLLGRPGYARREA